MSKILENCNFLLKGEKFCFNNEPYKTVNELEKELYENFQNSLGTDIIDDVKCLFFFQTNEYKSNEIIELIQTLNHNVNYYFYTHYFDNYKIYLSVMINKEDKGKSVPLLSKKTQQFI